jgi:hypothetical protein
MIVSKMEEFLGALVRIALTLHPETLGELSSVPDRIIKRYQAHISSSDILRWQIDQKVFDFINGSPDEWQAIIAKRMGIDIATAGADWARINEIIQRRHVITHNNGRVDESYMARVDDRLRIGLELGTPLLCGSNYILPALIEIETWTFCLALNWTKHFFKDRGQYHPRMISVVVDLEKVGRWTHALAVLDAFLRAPLPSGNISLARINRWFCLQEIGHNDESLEREIRAWKPQEADEEDALLAETGRAALLREYSELIRVLQRGIGAGMPSFEKKYLRDAPLMQRAMRESTSVARLLQGPEISVRRVQSRPKRHGRNKSR